MRSFNCEQWDWGEGRPRKRHGGFVVPARVVFAAILIIAVPAPAAEASAAVEERLRDVARPLEHSADLDELLKSAAPARLVLLGEATHGTQEFYRWRSILTQRLISEQGLRLVGVEGDWRPILELNAYLRGESAVGSAAEALRRFDRWPEWMWANTHFAELLEWIRNWNAGQPRERQVQVHGLDMYGHARSLAALETFFRQRLPERWKEMRPHFRKLRSLRGEGQDYTREILDGRPHAEAAATALFAALKALDNEPRGISDEDRFVAQQDASVVQRAEAFYRTMWEPGSRSWNVRAEHMWLTADRLLDRHGPAARMAVWAHNTHVGDARATDMAASGMVNLGRLARENYGANSVFIVGFATHSGEVVAGKEWGARHRVLPVPDAREASWDHTLQRALGGDGWLLFDEVTRADPLLLQPRPQRAIGVVYEPKQERLANYTQTVLPSRFDALLFLSRTRALQPLR